jgi:hypothetical protein
MAGRTASAAANRFILTSCSTRPACLATHRSMARTSPDSEEGGPLPMVAVAHAEVRRMHRAHPAIGSPATIALTFSPVAAARRRLFASPGACR